MPTPGTTTYEMNKGSHYKRSHNLITHRSHPVQTTQYNNNYNEREARQNFGKCFFTCSSNVETTASGSGSGHIGEKAGRLQHKTEVCSAAASQTTTASAIARPILSSSLLDAYFSVMFCVW